MKIDKFLEKINFKVKSGNLYVGNQLKEKLLYWVNFKNKKETQSGSLLIGSKNQQIYFIKYIYNELEYYYKNKIFFYDNDKAKSMTLKSLLELIEKE